MCKIKKIENMKNKMRRVFPKSSISFFYDYKNLKEYTNNLDNILNNIFCIVSLIYTIQNKSAIYIRLHGYKEWIMIRIASDNWGGGEIKDYLKIVVSSDSLYNVEMQNSNIVIVISKSIS